MQNQRIKKFQKLIWDFYKKNKRDFPWRNTKNPYHILVSEIMLQQTQTDRVMGYYKKWLKRFPNFSSLANATFNEIYPFWQGLGYNRRALALQKLAQKVIAQYKGKLPVDIALLEDLPGIGPYTAKAVVIFSHNTPVVCIETNIRRVFIHHFFPNPSTPLRAGKKIDDKEILKIAKKALDIENPRQWHYALMDYGAYLKKTVINPNRRHKNYRIQSKFEGSPRQLRGAILKILTKAPANQKEITQQTKPFGATPFGLAQGGQGKRKQLKQILSAMIREGFVEYNSKNKLFYLKQC